MWGQGYRPDNCQQFLRLRRAHGRNLPTAERRQEQRSWTEQQNWREIWEQAPVLDPILWIWAGTPSSAPWDAMQCHAINHTPWQEQAQTLLKVSKILGRVGNGERGVPWNAITTAGDLNFLREWESWPMPAPFFFLSSHQKWVRCSSSWKTVAKQDGVCPSTVLGAKRLSRLSRTTLGVTGRADTS